MLRLSEHYTSVQGEGPRVGTLTQFVRFAGCNMRCPGWPCDTQHAIDPSIWRFESEKIDGLDLAERVLNTARETGAYNICLTGGEPFLQPGDNLFDIVDSLAHPSGMFTWEVFTNGSFAFPNWTKLPMISMLFTMDWKLEGSGEAWTARDTRMENAKFLDEKDGIKFVVKDRYDLLEAINVSKELRTEGFKGVFWVGRAWDAISDDDIVKFMQEEKLNDWRLNVQVHKYIWPADERGV